MIFSRALLILLFAALLPAVEPTPVLDRYAQLPLAFEPNLGQASAQVQYVARAAGYALFVTPTELTMAFSPRASQSASKPEIIRMKLEGGSRTASVTGLDKLHGISAYFTGSDPSKWLPEVPQYGRIQYRTVYPGVDLVYYGNGRQLEYDFVVSPGADPNRIRLSYDGQRQLRIDSSGDLILSTSAGDLKQPKPHVYQVIDGRRIDVDTTYALNAGKLAFAVAPYRHDQPLVIDPVLIYSTFFGGNARINDLALDSSGSVYVAGETVSFTFPVKNAFQSTGLVGLTPDAFVAKLNPPDAAGRISLAYSTYLGGNNGDRASGIAIDPTGAAYLSGTTDSRNFPIANAYQAVFPGNSSSGFVTKLNPYTGSGPVTLAYSTYLGGNYQQFEKIAVDPTGAAYVVGSSFSADFPFVNGLRPFQTTNAFVARLNPYPGTGNVTLAYSTSLGSGRAIGIAVDPAGAAYVTGVVYQPDLVTANAFQSTFVGEPGSAGLASDAFVAKLNPFTGGPVTLAYSTYLGGTGFDSGYAIAIDSAGAAYVAGATSSTDFPLTNALQTRYAGNSDTFVTKLKPYSGTGNLTLDFSTYLGGASSETAYGIALDSARSVYVTGFTRSANYPILDRSPAGFSGPFGDAFITKLNPSDGAPPVLAWSVFLGGNENLSLGNRFPDTGTGIAIDQSGAVQVVGYTFGPDFPLVNAFQTTFIDIVTDALLDSDGFIAKFAPPGTVVKTPVNVTMSNQPGLRIVYGQPVTFSAAFSSTAATGTAYFVGSSQGAVLCSAQAAGGVATCTSPGSAELVIGSNTVTAGYLGDSTYTLGSVTPLTVSVDKASTSTSLSVTPPNSSTGPVTLTANVAVNPPGQVFQRPAGTVSFTSNGISIPGCFAQQFPTFCTNQCTVTCFIFLPPVGPYTLGASYSGDSFAIGSVATPVRYLAGSIPGFSMTATPSAPVYGQPVTLNITAPPQGGGLQSAVSITDGATPLGSVVLGQTGQAFLPLPLLTAGVHDIRATYNNVLVALLQLTVQRDATTTSFSVSTPSPGQVTITATVAPVPPGAGNPTGTVVFYNNVTTIAIPLPVASATLVPTGSVSTATVTVNASPFTNGILAAYPGDLNFVNSTSASTSVPVLPPSTGTATVTVNITAGSNTPRAGQPVPITVSVVGLLTAPAGALGLPNPASGVVSLFDNGVPVGPATLANGQATFNLPSLAAGVHLIRADYSGDSIFGPASANIQLTVAAP